MQNLFFWGKSISTSKTPKRPLGLSEIPTGPTRYRSTTVHQYLGVSLDAVVRDPGLFHTKLQGEN